MKPAGAGAEPNTAQKPAKGEAGGAALKPAGAGAEPKAAQEPAKGEAQPQAQRKVAAETKPGEPQAQHKLVAETGADATPKPGEAPCMSCKGAFPFSQLRSPKMKGDA